MQTFKPTKKGVIEIFDKKYLINVDTFTIATSLAELVDNMENEKSKANNLKEKYDKKEIDSTTYIDEIQEAINAYCQHAKRLCIRTLGRKCFEEIDEVSSGLNFDDLNQLTSMIMYELIDMNKSKNINAIEAVKAYE